MRRHWPRVAIGIFAAAFVLSRPAPVQTCAPLFERAVFVHVPHPDFPLSRFAAGDLGVLQPTYARSYLVVAYRYLIGRPLTSREQQALRSIWNDRLGWLYPPFWDARPAPATAPVGPSPVDRWLARRNALRTDAPLKGLDTFRPVKPGEYFDYQNCLDDAFAAASRTLDRMQNAFGPTSPTTAEWLRGQDAVFANCGRTSAPGPLPLAAGASAQASAERDYQIAAADFYRGEFDLAAERFRRIAGDSASSWRSLAPYLAARALIRKATLLPEPGQIDRQVLMQADQELGRILSDPAQVTIHPMSRRLLGFVRFRLTPEARLAELGAAVAQGSSPDTFAVDASDFTLLLDRVIGERPSGPDTSSMPSATDPLADWIATMQWPGTDALDHAIARWNGAREVQWLVAAMSKISGRDPRAAELRAAAAQVSPGTPAYFTVTYHRLRLAIESGEIGPARIELDRVLAAGSASMPRSADNLFRALRLRTSFDLDDWLAYATRQPTTSTWDTDASETPTVDVTYSRLVQVKDPRLFDTDAASALNRGFPLADIIEIAGRSSLPAGLRGGVALAAWTRAVLLKDDRSARAIAPVLKSLVPELARDVDDYLGAADDAERQLSAVVTLLRFPGMRPLVDAGLGRDEVLGKIENFRDNWWCAIDVKRPNASPAFLTADERRTAEAEYARLVPLPTAPDLLAADAVRLARLRPADPRAPEVLHLAVRATRFGCTSERTGTHSQAAFDLLHRKYPNTEWARKTPYWYK